MYFSTPYIIGKQYIDQLQLSGKVSGVSPPVSLIHVLFVFGRPSSRLPSHIVSALTVSCLECTTALFATELWAVSKDDKIVNDFIL